MRRDIAEAAGLHVGDALDLTVVDGAVVILKVELGRRTDDTRPTAEDWFAAADYVGRTTDDFAPAPSSDRAWVAAKRRPASRRRSTI